MLVLHLIERFLCIENCTGFGGTFPLRQKTRLYWHALVESKRLMATQETRFVDVSNVLVLFQGGKKGKKGVHESSPGAQDQNAHQHGQALQPALEREGWGCPSQPAQPHTGQDQEHGQGRVQRHSGT